MNREQRRKLQKDFVKKGFDKDQAKKMVYLQDIREGNKEGSRLTDGTAVKIDVSRCLAVKGDKEKNPKYVEFVKANAGRVFHVQHQADKPDSSIVELLEDLTEPKWLFWEGDLIKIKEELNGCNQT